MYYDRTGNGFRTRYQEWLEVMRKEGGAVLKSVNPVMKSAYRQVKDKGRKAYRDVRSKMSTKMPSENASNKWQRFY